MFQQRGILMGPQLTTVKPYAASAVCGFPKNKGGAAIQAVPPPYLLTSLPLPVMNGESVLF